MKIVQIPALQDNYFYLIVCEKSGAAALIDPCDNKAAMQMVSENQVEPKWIINTHHHWDHVAANEELKQRLGCEVLAYGADSSRIPGFTTPLKEKQTINIGELSAQVLLTPGHTRHHISLYFKKDKVLFCGDTLFSAGCGRLFEGTAEQMVESLYNKLAKLPDTTQLFCGHEYTESNLHFASTLEPKNQRLQAHGKAVVELRAQDKPTIPSTIGLEKAINPFLRCGVSDELYENVVKQVGPIPNKRLAIFTAVRELKDKF